MEEGSAVTFAQQMTPETWGIIEQKGVALTLFVDERPVACGGVAPLWPGVGEVWVFLTKGATKMPLRMCRYFMRGLLAAQHIEHFHRIQCVVAASDARALKFAKHFGFMEEGFMRNYTQDKVSCVRLARVWL